MALPYLTHDLPGIGGVLRATADDFRVDELPAYAPSGAGDHVFARIEKRGLTTPQAVEQIARALGVAARDVGVAGMKDRHAVTRQWISLPPPVTPEAALAVAVDGVAVLEAARHNHKLRTGHLRGNRFAITVRDVAADAADRARAILAALVRPPGAPNWYGEQRFGKDGDNAARGRAIALGTEPMPRDKRLARLLVSALQSELFNAWLVARLRDRIYACVLAGDVLHKVGGGMFVSDDPETDTARLVAGELVLTGPMFGERMRAAAPDSPAAAREAAILAAAELPPDAFARVRALAEGTRRDATVLVGDATVGDAAVDTAAVEVVATDGAAETGTTPLFTLQLVFTLPAGAYATALLREIMKTV